ncbi:MAG TPA: MOSC domain-containing protein [Pseudomonadales bacterium]
MRVALIHRYPVKSMGGERLDAAFLGPAGIPGDRAWALRDEVSGGLTGAKKHARLMSLNASFLAEPDADTPSPAVRITDGHGLDVTSASGDVDARLSAALDHPVSLWPLLPPDRLDHYRREAAAPGTDRLAALRELFGRTPDEPLPDLTRFPSLLATYHSPPGTYFDAYPLLIMTRASLDALTRGAAAGGIDARFDVRRFRPNLLLETDQEGFVENAWDGRRLRIGDAEVQVEMPCPRCIMTTHGFADLPRDPRVMRALVRCNDGNLGVYASVVKPGRVAPGDRVELL